MAILPSELQIRGAVSMPEDDSSVAGGDIDLACKVEFTDVAAPITTAVASSGADGRQVTVTGRNVNGAIVSEVLTLNGTNKVAGTTVFERILKATLSASDAILAVTLYRNDGPPTYTAIGTFDPNVTKIRRMFYDSQSETLQSDRWEKVFGRNGNGSLTLNAAKFKMTADPSNKLMIGVAASKNDTATVANRKTDPGVSLFDDGVDISIPTAALGPGERIGVWVRQRLAGSDPAFKNTFVLQLLGSSI